jgi:hypothetical protein
VTDPISGHPGELIDRLMAVLADPAKMWGRDLGGYVEMAVGGSQLASVMPVTGTPKPGTVAERAIAGGARPVDGSEYLAVIRDRLIELVRGGVREDFLVRALRTELDLWLAKMADTGETDQQRREFREMVAENAGDDEDAQRRAKRIEELLPDTTAEAATTAWSQQQGWLRSSREVLSDEVLDGWAILWARNLGRPGQ